LALRFPAEAAEKLLIAFARTRHPSLLLPSIGRNG
jgi:hypothetical protein